MNDSLVIIPTYNERENVERMLETVISLPFPFDVLVVDDGSPDGTAALVKQAQATHGERIHLIEREGKLGLGTAYLAGFRFALQRGYDYVFEMDCDFSHNPEDLVRLRVPCAEGGAGMAVGSRYVKGGGVANWPWNRVLLSYSASIYVNIILGLGVRVERERLRAEEVAEARRELVEYHERRAAKMRGDRHARAPHEAVDVARAADADTDAP